MGKVSAGLVKELRDEINFQIARLKKEIHLHGATDGRLQSLHRMKLLKQVLSMLLSEGEVVLAGVFDSDNSDNSEHHKTHVGFWLKAAKFFRMVNPDEIS